MTPWEQITAAIGIALAGDKERGRRELVGCWAQTTAADYAERCVIAHYLADLQPDLEDEVTWDERALDAYPHLGADDLVPIGIRSVAGLAPSLHLNLGDGYLRQGRLAEARAQLAAGLEAQDALAEDGYGAMIRRGLARLEERIQAAG